MQQLLEIDKRNHKDRNLDAVTACAPATAALRDPWPFSNECSFWQNSCFYQRRREPWNGAPDSSYPGLWLSYFCEIGYCCRRLERTVVNSPGWTVTGLRTSVLTQSMEAMTGLLVQNWSLWAPERNNIQSNVMGKLGLTARKVILSTSSNSHSGQRTTAFI